MSEKHFDGLTPLGIFRVALTSTDEEDQVEAESLAMLARSLQTGQMIGFIGSGVSRGLGHKSWSEIIRIMVEYVLLILFHSLESDKPPKEVEQFRDGQTIKMLLFYLVHFYFKEKVKNIDNKPLTEDQKKESLTEDQKKKLLMEIQQEKIGKKIWPIIESSGENNASDQRTDTIFDKYSRTGLPTLREVLKYIKDGNSTFLNDSINECKGFPDSSEYKYTIAECCRKAIDRLGSMDHIKKFTLSLDDIIATVSSTKPYDEQGTHLIESLKGLKIRRFITTNYDQEIESSIVKEASRFPYDPEKKASGFPYDPEKIASLVDFGFFRDSDLQVFHLHGMANNSKDALMANDSKNSLILSERDYQKTYLREDLLSRRYREVFDAILSSHPLIFLGLGMSEEDVLRPFRKFLTMRRVGEVQRPLFAILPRNEHSRKPQEEITRLRFLYARHGIKVLYYDYAFSKDKKETDDTENDDKETYHKLESQAMTEALGTYLEELATKWQCWWRSWRKFPKYRHRIPSSDTSYIHGNSYHRQDKVPEPVEFCKSGTFDLRSLLVVGGMGAGKGSIAYHTAKQFREKRFGPKQEQHDCAIASFAYTNDFLNVIELVTAKLNGSRELAMSHYDPVDHFFETLDNTEALVILSGLERVLYKGRAQVSIVGKSLFKNNTDDESLISINLPIGEAVDLDVVRFLERFLRRIAEDDEKKQGCIMLLSSMVPKTCLALINEDKIKEKKAKHQWIFPVLPGSYLNALESEHDYHRDVLPLKKVLVDNVFALKTLSNLANIAEDTDVVFGKPQVDELERILTSRLLNHRPMHVVKAVLAALEATDSNGKATGIWEYAAALLEALSFFHSPVAEAVLPYLVKLDESNSDELRITSEGLANIGLLVQTKRDNGNYIAYGTHHVVRHYFSQRTGRISDVTHEPHIFSMSVFAHDNSENRFHSQKAFTRSVEIYDRIMGRAESLILKNESNERDTEIIQCLRAAFNLLRFNWSAVSIPRQAEAELENKQRSVPASYQADAEQENEQRSIPSSYDHYQRILLRLHNGIRKFCKNKEYYWELNKTSSLSDCFSETHGVLYANELSWLYNETGMAAYCSGATDDAYVHFRAAQVQNNEVRGQHKTYHQFAIQLNMALTQLDRGRLLYAKEGLLSLEADQNLMESNVRQTVDGYLGIVSFYLGDIAQSMTYLNKAISGIDDPEQSKLANEVEFQYSRRSSIFLRFRSNLKLMQQDHSGAARDLDRSLALAQMSNQPDLVIANHITRARLLRITENKQSWELLDRCYEFAWRIGSKRTEIDVKIQQAETALMQGNGELAGQLATAGLANATSHNLALRQTNCRVLLGGALLVQNHVNQGLEVLLSAKVTARQQGYQSMLRQIDSLETIARESGQPNIFLL